jgi:LuxR family transcriptional regulator, maltose regulon positive regulatory protein
VSAATGAPAAVLVDTKFFLPARGAVVGRPRLVDALASSPQRLKLVRAPAGWGKTTLVADWAVAAEGERRFAWVSLDDSDDEPARFWLYVIESLGRLDPEVGSTSLALLTAPGTTIEREVLPALINELASLTRPISLVLDDYHSIRSQAVNDQLGFLLDHLPPGIDFVLTSRLEPRLPLARMRARGDLLEIDASGLRFESEEARDLLNSVLGLDLGAAEIEKLLQRTEGWVAGLYLAALSLRGARDPSSFVDEFAGDDRNVVDYLGAEVLAAQPEEVRRALTRSSVLDRLCAPLMEAVADVENGAAMLREIERSNLFLIPLDSKREWYRYHHLFQELLRLELSLAEPGFEVELHRRAAGWFLDAGIADAAIRHTIAAGDGTEATELIARHWTTTLLTEAGDTTIEAWLDALGEETVSGDFRLCFARCYVELSLGRMDRVARWLAVAEEAPLNGPSYEGLASKEGGLACVRCAHYWESGDVGRALPPAHEVLEHEGEDSPWRAIGAAVIGLCAGARGDWVEGSKWCREYSRLGAKFGMHLNESSGGGSAAAFEAELGNWAEAEELARRALEISSTYGMNEHWMTSEAHLALGMLHAHRREPELAEPELERSAEVARRGAGPVITSHALLHLALLRIARDDPDGAREALDEANRLTAGAPDTGPFLPKRLAAARRRLSGPAGREVEGEELSERELEVLRLLATPMTQREIGERLYVSLNTVKSHARSIFRKLGASDRERAVERARELELL